MYKHLVRMKSILFLKIYSYLFVVQILLFILNYNYSLSLSIKKMFSTKKFYFLNYSYLNTEVIYGVPYKNIKYNLSFYENLDLDISRTQFDTENSHFYATDEQNSQLVADPNKYNLSIIVFNDIFITTSFAVSDGQHRYALRYYRTRDAAFSNGWDQPVKYYEESVIAFGHLSSWIFGHLFFDVLTPLMLLPDEFINNSKIILSTNGKYPEIFKLLNIKEKNIIYRDTGIIFAKTAYMLYPAPHISLFGTPIKKLRDNLIKNIKIKNIPHYRYIIMNRVSPRRQIATKSLNEVVRTIKKVYNEFKWEVVLDNSKSFIKNVQFWNTIKFIIAPTGSNFMFIMFMQKDSVVVSIQCNCKDTAFNNLALTFDVLMIAYSNGNCMHFPPPFKEIAPKINVDISSLLRILKVAMYANNNHRFPNRSLEYKY